jgi:phosphoribosylglycinamide formyltransferase-1
MPLMAQQSKKKKIIILTGSELRHDFFRKYLALSAEIEVLASYCEGTQKSLSSLTKNERDNELRMAHLRIREQSEEDFFAPFVKMAPDRSNPIAIPKGKINTPSQSAAIIKAAPDLLVCYGSSIIREPLLSAFPRRFLNIHLGLSPYYRGSGTNFWPLVNGEPEYVGVTFMHIDAGVDTGEIIHQMRAKIALGDNPVQIGNRLISAMAETCLKILGRWDKLKKMRQLAPSPRDKIFRKKDYTERSVLTLYKFFSNGLVRDYLWNQTERCAAVPLVQNPALRSE